MYIANNSIENDGAENLAKALSTNSALEVLHLGNNVIPI